MTNKYSIELAEKLFNYDPETGVIRRKVMQGGQIPGAFVGTKRKDGYLATKISGVEILCHRLAWLLHYRSNPEFEIDHINGNRDDNRISNLRPSDRTHNNTNRRKAHKNNQLGILGVRQLESKRFLARIRVNKSLKRLGIFDTSEAASAAYVQAKRNLHSGNTL